MNCRNAMNLLLGQADEALAAEENQALTLHVGACPRCAERARQLQLNAQWLRELPEEEPSENFEWRLKLRLAQKHQPPLSLPGRREVAWGWHFAGAAAAAALLVVAVGMALLPGSSQQIASVGAVDTAVPARPHGSPGLPTLGVRPAYLRVVPTSSAAPLGPFQDPAPSIVGNAAADTLWR